MSGVSEVLSFFKVRLFFNFYVKFLTYFLSQGLILIFKWSSFLNSKVRFLSQFSKEVINLISREVLIVRGHLWLFISRILVLKNATSSMPSENRIFHGHWKRTLISTKTSSPSSSAEEIFRYQLRSYFRDNQFCKSLRKYFLNVEYSE